MSYRLLANPTPCQTTIIDVSTAKHYLKLASLLMLQFVVMYGGANWISAQRSDIHHIYFEWETGIPLIAPMAWVYASITPLMMLPVFFLAKPQLTTLAKQMAAAMLVATAVFLIYPGTTGYDSAVPASRAIEAIRSVDLPYNVFPSLHIALSSIIMLHLGSAVGALGRVLLIVWMAALIVSVILTHQHHVADVAGGLLLAYGCWRLIPGRVYDETVR